MPHPRGKTASTEALITQETFKVEELNLLSVLFLFLLRTSVEVESNLKDLIKGRDSLPVSFLFQPFQFPSFLSSPPLPSVTEHCVPGPANVEINEGASPLGN